MATLHLLQVTDALFVSMIALLGQTASTLRDSQGGRLKFVAYLLFREFPGREITDALNRGRIIFKRQFERPSAVFVLGVLYVGGYGPVADMHGVDVSNSE